MADNMTQYIDLWGSVQFEDREENHKMVTMGDEEKLIHSIAVKSNRDGKTVYVSFFDDSFPGFEHPGANRPIFIHGTMKQNGEYTNVTAKGYALIDGYVAAKGKGSPKEAPKQKSEVF